MAIGGSRAAGYAAALTLAAAAVAATAWPRGGPPAPDDPEVIAASIAFFEDRLAEDPSNPAAAAALISRYTTRFRTQADLADLGRAQDLARDAAPRSLDPAQANASLASVLLMGHEFAGALAAARAAVSADPDDEEALAALYDAAFAVGNYAEAEEALAALPADGMAWRVRQAAWFDAHGKSGDAADTMRPVCEQLERSGRRLDAAWCLSELAGLEAGTDAGGAAARRSLERALHLRPGYRGALEGLADLAYAEGDLPTAKRLYERIASDAHPDLYLRLAEISAIEGEAAAEARWNRLFEGAAFAEGHEALFAPSIVRYLLRSPEGLSRAAEVARRDVVRRPTVEAHDLLGWVQFLSGDLEEALASSDSAHAWGVPTDEMRDHRARILAARRRSEQG